MKLSKSLTTVTRFSKLIALLLFIMLPLAGFYMGMRYQQKLNDLDNLQKATELISVRRSKNNVTPIQYDYTLRFKNETIILDRMGSGKIEGTFYKLPVIQINYPVDPSDPTKTLYDKEMICRGLFYINATDTFYELEPGGYRIITLIDSSDLDKKYQDKNELNSQYGTKVKRVCQEENYPMGVIQAKGIKCTTKTTLISTGQVVDESSTTNCYLPLNNGKIFAYEQKLKPVSTNINTCDLLEEMGVQNASIGKDRE